MSSTGRSFTRLVACARSCFFVDDRQPIVERAQAFGLDAMLFRGPEHFAAELRKRELL